MHIPLYHSLHVLFSASATTTYYTPFGRIHKICSMLRFEGFECWRKKRTNFRQTFIIKTVVCIDSLEAGKTADNGKEVKIKSAKSEFTSVKLEPNIQPESDNRETLCTEAESSVPMMEKKFDFVDSVAAFHATAVKKSRDRQTLVSNLGPHRRALCARRDLAVRRALCKVDKVPASLISLCLE